METKDIVCDVCGRVLGSVETNNTNFVSSGYECGKELLTHADGTEIPQ